LEKKEMVVNQIDDLIKQFEIGGMAYVRNLAVAEDAVQKGQSNISPIDHSLPPSLPF
jgi:hypothetical protein